MAPRPSTPPPHPARPKVDSRDLHEVWAWNLDAEFDALLAAMSGDEGRILALDTEFPGFLREEPRSGARDLRYQALRENVDSLQPIQVGASVAEADGVLCGTWTFNLQFDIKKDLHTQASVEFLRAAGIDFARHAKEGIEAQRLGKRIAKSSLVGQTSPEWVTFAGSYDLGFLLKLLTKGNPLPSDVAAFETALVRFCPRRHELRDELPRGSLDNLARQHGVKRHGVAHTAGSDALLTLELYLAVVVQKGKQQAREQTWDSHMNWYPHGWGNNQALSWYGTAWDCTSLPVSTTTATGIPLLTSTSPLSTPAPVPSAIPQMPQGAVWSQPWHGLRTTLQGATVGALGMSGAFHASAAAFAGTGVRPISDTQKVLAI